MRIGIFGGTFDPVHLGHIWTARAVRDELELDKLLLVVTEDPPHKHNANRTDGQTRYKMLEAALKSEEGIFPSDVELLRGGTSYTVDTVRYFRETEPSARLYLIVGGDMLENFPMWRRPSEIMSMCSLAAVSRPDSVDDMLPITKHIESAFGGEVILTGCKGPRISSTEVRSRVYDALPIDMLVPLQVDYFIHENAMYMPQDIVDIYKKLSGLLDAKRLRHTMLTVREAILLADANGVDTKKARLAAILHDCVKLSNRNILALAKQRCYDLTPEEIQNPYLIHARLGAVAAVDDYGVTDREVLQAIENHTLGKAGMTMLDKVIYLADKIEPSRDYEGVAEIREAAYKDVNMGMILVMQHTMDYTSKNGRLVNPTTSDAMESIKKDIKNKLED